LRGGRVVAEHENVDERRKRRGERHREGDGESAEEHAHDLADVLIRKETLDEAEAYAAARVEPPPEKRARAGGARTGAFRRDSHDLNQSAR
jgi:hypothetical protein